MEYECKKCFGWGQNTGQPVGSMGGFEGGNELLTVLGLGQWTRHVGVAEGRVEKLKEKFCGDGSSVMGLRAAERVPCKGADTGVATECTRRRKLRDAQPTHGPSPSSKTVSYALYSFLSI